MLPSIKSASSAPRRENKSASMETSSSGGGSGNWPSSAWLPMMTNRSAPVMPAEARMMCSSCGRCMAAAGFDLPDFPGGEGSGKGRVLAQALAFPGFGGEGGADLVEGAFQKLLPLLVTAQQGGHTGIEAGPALEIGAGKLEPFRMLRQSSGDAPGQFQAGEILNRVIHARKLACQQGIMPDSSGRRR